jgi:hypothetical protein
LAASGASRGEHQAREHNAFARRFAAKLRKTGARNQKSEQAGEVQDRLHSSEFRLPVLPLKGG